MKEYRTWLGRRNFLKTAIAGAGALMLKSSRTSATVMASSLMTWDDFKRRLRGPILSFPTTYTADFKLDYQGMRNMIERGLKGGVRVVALTNGNSQYSNLTYDEVKQLTRFMVEAVGGRGVTIAATGPWWTGQAQDYARFAESLGADAVQVLPPAQVDDEGLFEHFNAVAASTKLGLVIHAQPSLAAMKRLMTIDSVVAFKEEATTDYTVPLYQAFGDRLNIFAGGTKARFLAYRPYGMHAYYSAFSTFAPKIAMRFWNAVQNNDQKEAAEIILKYDVPFFERWSDAFWRATLEYFGIAKRYVRPPERSLSDKQVEDVKVFYQGLGLSPGEV